MSQQENVRAKDPKSIEIPCTQEAFRNLRNAKRFAIDIGISLTKIAYYSTISHRRVLYDSEREDGKSRTSDKNSFMYEVSEGARLHFIKFETKYIEHCLDFVRANLIQSKDKMVGKTIKATGIGTFKYADLLQDKLGLSVDKEDEIDCLIKGCNFLLKNISNEAFTYHRHGDPEYVFQSADPNIFPYMLVNIGSGVSIMKVESENCHERIGGTATGGGTFWGLGSLLTSAKGFDELLDLAEKGDHRNVDVLVGDLSGSDYEKFGLSGDLIASAFGKAMNCNNASNEKCKSQFAEADIAKSLLFTISNDIGQIACLYAMMHNLKKVYFGGHFLRNHPLSMHTVSFAINYWSRGQVQSLFLRHEGYLGAIGAFLKGAEECDTDKYSWQENYDGSSGLQGTVVTPLLSGLPVSQLEIDRWESAVGFCPLLADPADYTPDTVNLTQDNDARHYWLDSFETSVDKYVQRAVLSQPDSETAEERGQKFKDKFVARIRYLRTHPFAYGSLTVRSLLDTIEHCLRELDFPDPYLLQKQMENETALNELSTRFSDLDKLSGSELHEVLVTSILAGNMFDWGAAESVKLIDKGSFGLKEALGAIQPRPWLIDDLDLWIQHMNTRPAHNCAAIFVDNCGVDLILGIIPFAREMLKRGTRVLLCSNSEPALNDVTHTELLGVLSRASSLCPVIAEALTTQRLIAVPTAQSGPCLDLSRVSIQLIQAIIHHNVDLIVIEGMGRALHTNLLAKFKCDCLKLAVIKNRWLAQRLGGDIFSVLCKFEPKPFNKCSLEDQSRYKIDSMPQQEAMEAR
ncbi:4'-phosphopantetheine phosphatase [Frankliniella fusca]|uniref:4'-phosphopantetheine phosphatase n=1 Tax=Frankliniella fusca TaxID=407009 RepID=A0AAE1HQX4_9NEOP|nr:4'-phosphopantetheine phosphatase [Frankliniella fusca]